MSPATTDPLSTIPAAPTKRSAARLWIQVRKAAIPALVTAVFGYAGGMIVPPTAVYDRLFRQDPNDLGGTWYGSVAGTQAKLILYDKGEGLLSGTLSFGRMEVKVSGNHDSKVVLEGPVDADHVLKIGLTRKVGDRYGADDSYVMLLADDSVPPALICKSDALDITDPANCRPLPQGITFFARKRAGASPKPGTK